ncbi:hypothetical protein KIL84_005701 [Mauremys mutica]|uniref:Uncharacterized protein n=1 Tax=Mauremys mutica TaxID=74926 RepID=A0A9D3XH71_9SAUR|nr:hypothetical protein KIL84_005701 [Mauremys mutica]
MVQNAQPLLGHPLGAPLGSRALERTSFAHTNTGQLCTRSGLKLALRRDRRDLPGTATCSARLSKAPVPSSQGHEPAQATAETFPNSSQTQSKLCSRVPLSAPPRARC